MFLRTVLVLFISFRPLALMAEATPASKTTASNKMSRAVPVGAAGSRKDQWQNHFRGPEQILTISACSDKGCRYEFKGDPKAPCTDVGQFAFANAEQIEATAVHRIGAKTCKFEFTLDDDGSVEVDDSCVCNIASESDLGGAYKKF